MSTHAKRYWCASAVEVDGTLSARFHQNSHYVLAADYDAVQAELDALKSALQQAREAIEAGAKAINGDRFLAQHPYAKQLRSLLEIK